MSHIERWPSDQKLKHVGFVPGGLLPLGPHTGLGGLVATHEVEGNLAQQGQVARRGAIAHATVVFAECDIEHPVQRVFHRPVRASHLTQGSFRTMIAAQKPDDLDPWLTDAAESELASFASGIVADGAAVRAAIVESWSNEQTEGQVTKLKLVKRQIYGRGKLDLLRARLTQTI